VSAIRSDYTPHARAERLIATGRFALASASLAAVYLEPSTPVSHQSETYLLLLVYTAYALATMMLAWRAWVPSMQWRFASHALDLVLFTVFVYLTEGPASPFFLYFSFSLFCATVRFSWRGILATWAMAMTIYVTIAVIAWVRDPDFEVSRVLIRVTYLGVLAALLVYLGIYQQRLREELASLAAWPRELAARIDDVLGATLAHAASVVRAPRVLLVWEESEEPWVYVATYARDGFRVQRVPPGTYDAPLALENASLFVSQLDSTANDPIGATLRAQHAIGSAIVVALSSETLSARFIVPDVRAATADDLALAHIAGRLVLATLEQFFFVQQVQQSASADERLRISRELHDGVVQSLAGIGLRLQTLRTRDAVAADIAEEIAEVQRVLEHDQRELRAIVRELRPHDTRDGRAIVAQELQRMRERFPMEWGLDVQIELAGPVDVSARVAHELCRIVNESLANAARHGGASRAIVTVAPTNGAVDIRVDDNGRGFAFEGRHDLASLERLGQGPRTLKERVRSLSGALMVASSRSGASIEVHIPMQEER